MSQMKPVPILYSSGSQIFLGVQKFYELHYFPFRGILGRFLNLIEKESQISLANSYLCIINIDKIYRDIPEL